MRNGLLSGSLSFSRRIVMEHIFRAYDIRGIYGNDLTVETAVKIGNAIGVFTRNRFASQKENCEVLVGRDVRKSSDTIGTALISGILSAGVDVTNVGTKAFGDTLFSGWKFKKDVLVYITASHLTPEWNGVKLYYGDGQGFPEEDIAEIGRIVQEEKTIFVPWEQLGNVTALEYTDPYITYLKEYFTIDPSLRIGLDCGGGSTCLSAPRLLEEMGMQYEKVFCDVDPYFSGRKSEPTDTSLGYLKEAVIKEGLDFGVGFDGDGDRGVIVDDKGRVLSADIIGIIFGKNILKNEKGVILANVESSMAIEDMLIPLGADVKRIKVGHTFLTMEAKAHDALLGIERSGHMIIPSLFLFDDALPIPLKLAEILSKEKRPLSELADEIPIYPKNTTNFDVDDAKKFRIIEKLRTKFATEHERVNILDGVRVDLDKGWGLIRASNTSPVIRVTVEGKDETALQELITYFNEEFRSAERTV